MAREIHAQHVTGATLYAVLLDASGQPWNGSAFDATPTAGEWASYDIAMTEDSAMGYYVGTFPAGQAAGLYSYRVHKQIGGSPATTDPVVWTGEGDWDGTAWVGQSGDSFARIGDAGAGLTSIPDSAGITTLLTRVTGAVALATSTTAAAIRAALGMAAADFDAQLDDIASVTDPLLNTVPGAYPSGSGGHALGRIGSGQITTTSTVAQSGDIPEIVGGTDYNATDGNSFDWTDQSAAWPDLTGATVEWVGQSLGGSETLAMTVVTPTGASKKVRLELTAAQTAALQAIHVGVWTFSVWVTLATSARKRELLRGSALVMNTPGPS